MQRIMHGKYFGKVVVIFFSAMILVWPIHALAGGKQEIKFSTGNALYPAFAEQIGVNLYINSLIGQMQTHPRLKGKFQFKVYDKGMLYSNQSDALEAVANGAIQMTYSAPHFLEELDPSWKIGETPGVFESWDHFTRAMATPAWQSLHEKMANEKGVTILKWIFDTGTWFLYTDTGPVKSMADLKGQKIRFAGGEAFAKVLKGLGATPIALPYSEVVTALQTNMIEGLLTDFTGGVGFYELPRYTQNAVLVPFGNQPICMVVNTQWWNALDSEVRAALMIPFDQIDASQYYKSLEQAEIDAWRKNPDLVTAEFGAGEIKEWHQAMKTAMMDVVESVDPKLVQAIDSAR